MENRFGIFFPLRKAIILDDLDKRMKIMPRVTVAPPRGGSARIFRVIVLHSEHVRARPYPKPVKPLLLFDNRSFIGIRYSVNYVFNTSYGKIPFPTSHCSYNSRDYSQVKKFNSGRIYVYYFCSTLSVSLYCSCC